MTNENLSLDDARDVFAKELTIQLRAMDAHGIWTKKNDEELVGELFIRVKEPTAPLNPQSSDAPPATPKALPLNPYARLIFQSVAAQVEKQTGMICYLVAETSCDGTMKGLIYSGDRVILAKSLWNSNSLYFESDKGLRKTGGKMLFNALEKANEILAASVSKE